MAELSRAVLALFPQGELLWHHYRMTMEASRNLHTVPTLCVLARPRLSVASPRVQQVSRIQVTCASSVTLGSTPHSLWTPSSECRPILYIFFTAFFHSNYCCDLTGSWPKHLCIRGLLQWNSEVKFSRMKVRLPCVGKHNTQDIRNSVLHHLSASVNKFYNTCELPTGNLAS